MREFETHPRGVFAVAFSPDGKSLVTGGGDAIVKLWDTATGKLLKEHTLDHRKDFVTHVDFAPDGKSIVAGCGRGETIHWVFGDEEEKDPLAKEGTVAVAFVEGGKKLVVISNQYDKVRIHDLTGKNNGRWYSLEDPSGEAVELRSAAVSPDGSLLATIERSGWMRIWDMATGKPLFTLRGLSGKETTLAFSRDSKMLISGSTDTTLLLWDISRARFNDLWTGLTSGKDADAESSLKTFVSMPKESIPYLSERLQKFARIEDRVRKLAADLNDDDFEVREKVTRQLTALGTEAQFAFQLVLKNNPSAEVRKRIESVIASFHRPAPTPIDPLNRPRELGFNKFRPEPPGPKVPDEPVPSEGHALKRAFTVLETIGTADARKVVESLAGSATEGWLRDQAKTSLERFARPRP
jgi:hypothetical protein